MRLSEYIHYLNRDDLPVNSAKAYNSSEYSHFSAPVWARRARYVFQNQKKGKNVMLCMHCKENEESKMYNQYICKKCRVKWEENPHLSRKKNVPL